MGSHPFETVSSDLIYRGKIIALRADEVTMPDGGTARREVVEHFGAVAVAAVDDANRVAVIYQYRHAMASRLWELPAGLLDVAEENPAAAAARELREEVGLVATDWSTLIDVASSPGFTDEALRVYLARGLKDVGRPPGEHEEADLTVDWMDLEYAVGQVLSGEIVNATAAAGILAAHAVIAGGRSPRPLDAPWPSRPTALARRQGQP